MNHDRTSPWDMLSLLMWAVVFAAGLVPDLAFEAVRALGNVRPDTAMINSSYAITFALSGYFAIFVLQRCREAGATEGEARSKALVAGLMGLAAFLELPNRGSSPFEPRTFLEVWIHLRLIEDAYLRNVVLAVGASKLFCWWYLFALLLRYYAFGNRRVFRSLPPVMPRSKAPGPAPAADSASEAEAPATSLGD